MAKATKKNPKGKTEKTPVKVKAPKRDPKLAALADKDATDYQKWFARYITLEVGYDPDSASSKKAAFLAGIRLALTARTAFMESDFLEELREKHGINKRGPKPKDQDEETPRKGTKAKGKKAKDEDPEDDEFEDDDEEIEDDEEEDDDEFEDDESEDDDEDEDEEEDDDEDEDEEEDDEEEDEPAPKKAKGKKPVAKKAPAKKAAKKAVKPAKKATPAKKAGAKKSSNKEDDEFLF